MIILSQQKQRSVFCAALYRLTQGAKIDDMALAEATDIAPPVCAGSVGLGCWSDKGCCSICRD